LQQLREVWTKTFKSSAAAEDDVQEDDVEMTVEGGASSVGAPADEDAFEKQMRHSHEATTEQLRASTVPRYVKPQALDQLEEWMKEKPILTSLMTSSVRKASFTIGLVVCQGTLMSTKRTRMSLGCSDSSMVALHLEAG
jgi:hypothetical protein